MKAGRILIVDDLEDTRKLFRDVLEYEGYAVKTAGSGEQGLAAFTTEAPDLIFLDVKMPGMDGVELLEELKRRGCEAPIIMISGHGTIETACQALRLGAYDFIEKPLSSDKLLATVRNVLETRRLAEENRQLRLKFDERYRLLGESAAMKEVRTAIGKAAPTNATVLITGESGTGKELVARAIYRNSLRSRKPFVQVNCAAIPEELIESELFGHEKGSFTGASDKQVGKFVQADGGTMFLDEIADMSLKTQAKVLRVLQEGEVEPVGAGRVLRVDVRVIAATNKDLRAEIAAERFREDLFFRLNVVPIRVAPLRDRVEDIPILVEHFLATLAAENGVRARSVSPEALARLCRCPWFGNVRELRNALERMLIMADGEVLEATDLPEEVRSEGQRPQLPDVARSETLREFKEVAERAFLVEKLRANGWNISLTAQKIDTPRSNLYKKIESYKLSEENDG